jgi:hypothetical protein
LAALLLFQLADELFDLLLLVMSQMIAAAIVLQLVDETLELALLLAAELIAGGTLAASIGTLYVAAILQSSLDLRASLRLVLSATLLCQHRFEQLYQLLDRAALIARAGLRVIHFGRVVPYLEGLRAAVDAD